MTRVIYQKKCASMPGYISFDATGGCPDEACVGCCVSDGVTGPTASCWYAPITVEAVKDPDFGYCTLGEAKYSALPPH